MMVSRQDFRRITKLFAKALFFCTRSSRFEFGDSFRGQRLNLCLICRVAPYHQIYNHFGGHMKHLHPMHPPTGRVICGGKIITY